MKQLYCNSFITGLKRTRLQARIYMTADARHTELCSNIVTEIFSSGDLKQLSEPWQLVSQGLVVSGNYNKIKLDQTKWYAIDYAEVDGLVRSNSTTYADHVSNDIQPDNFPLGQNDPLHKSNMPQSNRAYYSAPLGQSDPMQQVNLNQCNSAHCPTPSEQLDPLQQVSLTHAIPENKKEIKHKRLTNKTNTQRRAAPTAGVCAFNSGAATVDIEILEPAELLFDEFWKLYPRKESKQQAKKAWLKLNPDQTLFNLIANALEYRSQTKEWLAEGGRYIPHPATWLNGRRWEDEINLAKIDQSVALEERYSEITIDGKPLDPVQRKQLEYIEKQMRERQGSGGVV